jgi:quercetin dioxygenase-like cupin family protein
MDAHAVLSGGGRRDLLGGGSFARCRIHVRQILCGLRTPLHAHTATERIYVSRGNLLLERPNSETIQKPMGEYFVVKAGAVHTTVCAGPEDCFCYISIDRAFDVIPFRHDNRF